MTPTPKRAEPLPPAIEAAEPLDLTERADAVEPAFDDGQWAESQAEERGAGGRQVLGTDARDPRGAVARVTAPGRLAARWSVSRCPRPQFAQWVAVAAGPLALLGLVWLMFGRTRRKEAERFTRSVIAMRDRERSRSKPCSKSLSQRIHDSRAELTMISQHLMQLGDEATGKLGGITREFDTSSEKLRRHGEALDRAAETARNDIARAARGFAARRSRPRARWPSSFAHRQSNRRRRRPSSANRSTSSPSAPARPTRSVADATDRLAARLAEIETAGSRGASRVNEARSRLFGRARRLARPHVG